MEQMISPKLRAERDRATEVASATAEAGTKRARADSPTTVDTALHQQAGSSTGPPAEARIGTSLTTGEPLNLENVNLLDPLLAQFLEQE